MRRDENGTDGMYRVRSLYFDSLYDSDLQDNLDGVLKKRKIRLRCYPPDFSKAKLECKAKDGSDGTKLGVWLNENEIRELISGNYSCLTQKDGAAARCIYQRMVQGAYKPKTVVEYTRTAYLYPVSDTRITFDREQRGTVTGAGFLDEYPAFLPLTQDGMGVLEIKYNDFMPYPLMELMRKIDSLSAANSKYTQARSLI